VVITIFVQAETILAVLSKNACHPEPVEGLPEAASRMPTIEVQSQQTALSVRKKPIL
jgi:hypothetical protein